MVLALFWTQFNDFLVLDLLLHTYTSHRKHQPQGKRGVRRQSVALRLSYQQRKHLIYPISISCFTRSSREQSTKRLEGIRDIHCATFLMTHGGAVYELLVSMINVGLRVNVFPTDMSGTRLNRSAIDDDSWSIMPSGSQNAPGHIFVAPWNRDITIIVLCL